MMKERVSKYSNRALKLMLLWCLAIGLLISLSACGASSAAERKNKAGTENNSVSDTEGNQATNLNMKYKVMIDPGHGGSDPGATVDKLYERDYTLSIAKKVIDILKTDKHIEAKLTRSEDVFVDVAERGEMANDWNADILVSIHGNTFTDENVSGTEVLYTHENESIKLAQSLQQSLVKSLGFRDRGIRKEQLIILSHSTMPGALIEVGYLTNTAERTEMTSSSGQLKTAQAIAEGIIKYFEALELEQGINGSNRANESQGENNTTGNGESPSKEANEQVVTDYKIDRKIYYNGKKEDGKQAALTFDDGPDKIATPQVLEILKRHNVKATFFMLGTQVEANPKMVKRIVDEGHVIGNHSWSHPNLAKNTMQEVKKQINDTQDILEDITGIRPILFRPPYGNLTKEQQDVVFDMGLAVVNWSVDTLDWKGVSSEEIVETVHKEIWPGGIILQHNSGGKDNRANTIGALETIITELKEKGYSFVTVPELLHLPESL